VNNNFVSRLQTDRSLAFAAVNPDMTGIDRPLQRGAAEPGKPIGQEDIEPPTCVRRLDGEMSRPVWEINSQWNYG
jgi:hypothetical protein